MRKFFIENGIGARYPLNGEQGIWFTKPQGLGVVFNSRFGDIGDGFFTPTYTGISRNSVTGNITFLRDVYSAYREFANWLMTSEELYFIYQPEDTQYRVRVKVNFITKSEINVGRWLQTPVSFVMLTPWFKASPLEFNVVPSPDNVMMYSWVYGDAVFGQLGGNMSVIVPPDGHIPASWELTYTGELVNPVILITGESSASVIGRIEIEATIAAGDTLSISTRYLDSHIRSAAQGDLMAYVDLSYDPFPRLPLSEPSVISITANNEITGELSLSVNNYYRTV